jgi:GNAT superfamily N-acetyltransferase
MGVASDGTVRAARADEIEQLRTLEVDAGRRFADVGMAHVAGDEAPPAVWFLERVDAARLWVAVDDADRPVGYIAASEVDGEGHVDQVSVLEAWAGRGVGRALMDEVAGWARARGHHGVTLTTFRDVPWNGPWYRKLGYVDREPGGLGPELAAIRRREQERGLDAHPRVAMRLELGGPARPGSGLPG